MMPPDQESTSITGCPGAANNVIKCSRTENNSVHVEPLNSESNVDHMLDEQLETPAQNSILRHSLRPVTLKVCKN